MARRPPGKEPPAYNGVQHVYFYSTLFPMMQDVSERFLQFFCRIGAGDRRRGREKR